MTVTEATLTFLAGQLAAPAVLLAQAAGVDMPDLMPVGSSLVSLGFVGWYAWYVTAVAQPKIVSDFREEMKTERDSHARALDMLFSKFDRLTDAIDRRFDINPPHTP